MITISPVYDKFKFKASDPGSGRRGWSVMLPDLDAVHIALDHYHGRKHDRSKCELCKPKTKQETPNERR